MDPVEQFGRRRLMLALDVVDLPGDHPAQSARGARELADQPRVAGACQHVEGVGQQGVAGEYRHRLAEDLMRGRAAAAQIVVVERRQIVVDQRVGVDHLQRAGHRQSLGSRPATARAASRQSTGRMRLPPAKRL